MFPEKLWDLVHKTDTGVHWSEDGTCVEVDRIKLEKCIGFKFRSKNFDSFIRQLHFYGFRKAGNSYYHEKFQQNRFHEVLSMKRKYSHMTQIPATTCEAHTQTSTVGTPLDLSQPTMRKKKSVLNQNNNSNPVTTNTTNTTTTTTTVTNLGEHNYNAYGENIEAIDYSRKGNRSPSKTLSRNQEFIVVQVAQLSS